MKNYLVAQKIVPSYQLLDLESFSLQLRVWIRYSVKNQDTQKTCKMVSTAAKLDD